MKSNTKIKPAASLDASMLARKGEARPAIVATPFNNPALAWERADEAPPGHPQAQPASETRPANQPVSTPALAAAKKSAATAKPAASSDAVAMIFKMDEAQYLRLKYQAQMDDRTSQALIRTALDRYLDDLGAPKGGRWQVRPVEA